MRLRRTQSHTEAKAFFLYGGIPTHQSTSMPASTPVARSKSAALARVLDALPKGYTRCMQGTVAAVKAAALASKFHDRYGIGCTPAQRITRKSKGIANCLLVLYWPEGAERVDWLLLATNGKGLDLEAGNLREATDRPHLQWLGYELVRRAEHGLTAWTCRRPKTEMRELHDLLANQLNLFSHKEVAKTLQRLANQPGFHGVREQSKRLFEFARRRGYTGELPMLFYMRKVPHGVRMPLPSPITS